ncbi:MAG: sodium/solute symporter [Saprospiraceae bacterium]
MERMKIIWSCLFAFLFLNGIIAQKENQNSFLEISELGTIDFNYQGAVWFANEDVLMIMGGVDSLTDFNLEENSPPNWQPKIIAYPNPQKNNFQNPQLIDRPFAPISFAASAISPNGVYCIGGLTPTGSSSHVFHIKWDKDSQKVAIDTLRPLPIPLAFAGAAFFKSKLYVAGGYLSNATINKKLFILDLSNSNNNWETIDSPLEENKNWASLVVQSDGTDDCLFINQSEQEIFKYNLNTKKWKTIDIDLASIASFKAPFIPQTKAIGNSSILFFKSYASERSGSSEVGVLNTITNTYTGVGRPLPFTINEIIGETENGILTASKNAPNKYTVYKIKITEKVSGFGLINTIVLILYFMVMLWIGFYFSKKQKTADDYFKGGRRIPFWAAGLSLIGTGLSAITYVAVPAKAFATDWSYFLIRLSLLFVPFIIAYLYIPIFRGLDVSTAYEYLQKRFNLATRLISSLFFIIFQLGRIGIILYLPAVALNVVADFDVITCIILIGIISLAYTIMGGIEAVIWTDVIQVFILYGGIILSVIFISYELENGVTEIISIGKENNKFNILDLSFNLDEPNIWVVVFGGFFINLTTYGSDQSMVQRYLTTKSNKDATKSIWTTVAIGFILGWLFFFMGTALYAYYKTNPNQMLHTMTSNDALFPWYIISQLPTGVSGLLIAGIFAAAMSSLSSSMNSAATAYTMDFHQLFKKEFNAVTVGRLVTLAIGMGGILVAILFATLNVKSIWDEFLKIIGLMTGGLGSVFLLGLATKKANGAGVLIGLILSAVVQYFVGIYKPFNLLLYTASGFITCFVFGYLFSWLLPMYDKPLEGLTVYSYSPQKEK